MWLAQMEAFPMKLSMKSFDVHIKTLCWMHFGKWGLKQFRYENTFSNHVATNQWLVASTLSLRKLYPMLLFHFIWMVVAIVCIYVLSMLSLRCILISDLVVADIFMYRSSTFCGQIFSLLLNEISRPWNFNVCYVVSVRKRTHDISCYW